MPIPWTHSLLKSLPWPERIRVVHQILDGTEPLDEETSLASCFRLCLRGNWPKSKPWPKEPSELAFVTCGRATRWGKCTGERHPHGLPKKNPLEMGPLSDPAPVLFYRLAYLTGPRLVSFQNMYSNGGFNIFSPDRRFGVFVGFYKYELELTFFCRRKDLFVKSPILPKVFQCAQGADWDRRLVTHKDEWQAYRKLEDQYTYQGVIEPAWANTHVACKPKTGRSWMALMVKGANRPWDLYPGNNFRV